MSKGKRPPDRHSSNRTARPRRQRQSAPSHVLLQLNMDLNENTQHPLASLDPVIREAQRHQLIASILARIANGPIHNPQSEVTISESLASEQAVDDTPKLE